MRILILANFYPPYSLGGQEQSCEQVVAGLKERGHSVLVLTSMHGVHNRPTIEAGIHRSLYLEMDLNPWRQSILFFTRRKAREQENLQTFERVAVEFEPDLIFIWGMWNLPRSLAALVEELYPEKVVYRFAEYWPTLPSQHETYWRVPGRKRISHLIKKLIAPIALSLLAKENRNYPLQFKHTICVSAATRDHLVESGIPVQQARIIHTGIATDLYRKHSNGSVLQDGHQTLELLYAGRLAPDKGIETTIQAMGNLVFEKKLENIHLSIAGSGQAEYEKSLHRLVDQAGLHPWVIFLGHLPAEEMPELYKKVDVLLVPSIWPEPFARVVLEGMALGLVVIASTQGGSAEIIQDGENGILFQAGSTDSLTEKIVTLIANPELRSKLGRSAEETVTQEFSYSNMMDEIETFLKGIVSDVSINTPGRIPVIEGES